MDFFKNKTVRMVASILFAVSVVVLFLGGITPESMTEMITKLIGGVSAVVDIIAAIIDWINKDVPAVK